MTNKEFKTIEEQIAILKSRGLTIQDEEKAKDFLLKNNYYRISGYSLTLRNHDEFYEQATFQNIMDIYNFDHKMRHILLYYIEKTEVRIKSIYAYEFSKKYGPTGYLDRQYFDNTDEYVDIIHKSNIQKNRMRKYENYLQHFVKKMSGNIPMWEDIPFWAYVDLFTISDISLLYSISPQEIKNAVATDMKIEIAGGKILGDFMKSMTILRNLCAHGGRLYNRVFQQKPNLSSEEKTWLCTDKNGDIDNAHLYSFVLIIRRLLDENEFVQLKAEIQNLIKQYPFVDMRYYGFRNDWEIIL